MFYSRKLTNRINDLHYRAFRIIYQENSMTFDELLKKDGSVKIHYRNIQKLVSEMYKVKNHLSPTMMHEIFPDIPGF